MQTVIFALEHVECLGAVGGGDNEMALLGKRRGDPRAERLLVFGDQDVRRGRLSGR